MKTFTLDEANALVPLVSELVDEMAQVRAKIVSSGGTLEPVLRQAGGNGGGKAGSAYALLLQHFNACLATIQEWGVELKDLDSGLVDFPSYREGRIVYLCWKRGEVKIEFWHDIETGYAGRQPI